MVVESTEAQRTAPTNQRARRGARGDQVFETLMKEIVLGVLPPRAVLLELELASRFSCSQGTIREALLALRDEGLVNRQGRRGTVVANCPRDDQIELIRLRHDIETRGVARIVDGYGKLLHDELTTLIDDMRQAARDNDEYRLSVIDRAFHLRLYDEAGLPLVRPILRRCLVHNHRFKILQSDQRRDLMETANRHLPLTEALRAGDSAAAVQALSHHITTIVDLGPSILAPPELPGVVT